MLCIMQQQITKMSVGQLFHCSMDPVYDTVAVYKGFHLNQVELVGMVVNEKDRHNKSDPLLTGMNPRIRNRRRWIGTH